jgi:RNA polymerase sigma-70 factor (ECF subfamily)
VLVAEDPTPRLLTGSIRCVTDDELVLLARQGDTAAFDQLVVRHQVAVYRAAMAALRNTDEAEEAAQDAFVRAWSHLRQFRGEASFKTWLLRIVWRRAVSRRRRLLGWWRRSSSVEEVAAIAVAHERADEQMRDSDLRGHIARAIDGLTPKLRDAFLLASSGDYKYDEIAAMLSIAEGTLKWRVSEARRRVKRRLSELGYVHA